VTPDDAVAAKGGDKMANQRRGREALSKEVERLRRNAAERFPLGSQWNEAGDVVEYLYHKHQLVCDERDLDDVLAAFDQISAERPSVSGGPVGLAVLDLGDRDAADTIADLAGRLDSGVVSLNHVLDAQAFPNMCPATEPTAHAGPVADLGEPFGSGKPQVAVIDTGYLDSIARDSGYARFSAINQRSEADDAVYQGTTILPYGGHGTASAARLLAVAGTSVDVHVSDCLVGGAVTELTIVEDLERVMTNGAVVVSIQAGLYTQTGSSSKAFDAFYRRILRHHPETVLVVAAGNQATDRPFWPAAYDWCTAVGALTHGGDARTGWTNYGYWVDVYASGEDIVVPFPNGTYEYLDTTTAQFTQGHALWSGTSFAAPTVAGMIARRMIERNVDAPNARDIVLADAAVAALPTTGPRVLV
jgi:hypothetical protein